MDQSVGWQLGLVELQDPWATCLLLAKVSKDTMTKLNWATFGTRKKCRTKDKSFCRNQ